MLPYMSTYLSIYLSIYLFIYHLSTCLCIYQYLHLPIRRLDAAMVSVRLESGEIQRLIILTTIITTIIAIIAIVIYGQEIGCRHGLGPFFGPRALFRSPQALRRREATPHP